MAKQESLTAKLKCTAGIYISLVTSLRYIVYFDANIMIRNISYHDLLWLL